MADHRAGEGGDPCRGLADHLLVLRCQAGDDAAFAELHRRFTNRTLRYLSGLVGDDDARDVHQEVWLTVYRRLRGLANPAAFRTWLFQVTRNQGLDTLRKAHRREELTELVALYAELAVIDGGGAEMSELEWEAVREALQHLSPAHREVVVLRYWEDMTYSEIAVVTAQPVGTVRSRLHHAKAALRVVMEEEDREEGRTVTSDMRGPKRRHHKPGPRTGESHER